MKKGIGLVAFGAFAGSLFLATPSRATNSADESVLAPATLERVVDKSPNSCSLIDKVAKTGELIEFTFTPKNDHRYGVFSMVGWCSAAGHKPENFLHTQDSLLLWPNGSYTLLGVIGQPVN